MKLFIITPRTYKNDTNILCYICGSYTTSSQRKMITMDIKKIYQLYFGCHLGDQDNVLAPHYICNSCSSGLHDWLNKRKTSMSFAIPMIWRELRDHHPHYYFCNTNTTGFSVKNKHQIIYPNLDSARRPIPHDDTLPIPFPPQDRLDSIADEMETKEGAVVGDQLQIMITQLKRYWSQRLLPKMS